MKTLLKLCFTVLLCCALISPVVAMMVLPVGLDELVATADRIFVGTVTTVEERKDEHGIASTFVTVQISRKIKGPPPTTVTFKQLGWRTRQENGSLLRVPGMPGYREGEEVILFLHPTSAAGFTSPVGLEQGKFTLVRHGPKVQVVNSLGNANIIDTLSKTYRPLVPKAPGASLPVDLDHFLSLVEDRAKKLQTPH